MTAVVCTCIRHERDARLVAVPDPTCPHPTVDADQDALRAAAGLGRLLRWTARLLLAAILLWLFATDTTAMTAWHWAAAALATPLAWIAAPRPKDHP